MIVDKFIFNQGFPKQKFCNSVVVLSPPKNLEYLIAYSVDTIYVYKYDYFQPQSFFKLDQIYQLQNGNGMNPITIALIYAKGQQIYVSYAKGINIFLLDYSQNFKQLNSQQDYTSNEYQMIFFNILYEYNRVIMTLKDGTVSLFDLQLSLIRKGQMKDYFMTAAWNIKDDLFVGLVYPQDLDNQNNLPSRIIFWDGALNKFEQSIQTLDFLFLYYINQSFSYSEFYQLNPEDKNDTQVVYTSHWDSNLEFYIMHDQLSDELLVGNLKNNAQINQNFKNFNKLIEFQKDELLQQVFFAKQEAYIVIHTNQQFFVQSICNWSIIYEHNQSPFVQIVQSDKNDGIIAGFTQQSQIIVWNLYKDIKQTYQAKSNDLQQILYLQDLILVTLQSKGSFIICDFNQKADIQLECVESIGFNDSQITQLKMDYQLRYIFSLSMDKIVIQNINQDLFSSLINQIMNIDQYFKMLIDEMNQRLFLRSLKQIIAYTYQGLLIQQITESQNENLIIDFLLGDNVFLYYTEEGIYIFDRYSLILLAIQNTDATILQIIIMENLNEIAYITNQRNIGSVHLYSFETFTSTRSKIQILSQRASYMYYDEQNMYLITVNEVGDITIWEMSPSSQLTSYKQYLTNKSLKLNISYINIVLDNQNNYFLSYNDNALVLWEYSHYITKSGEYETLPIKFQIPHIYDSDKNSLLIFDENQNLFMYGNNQYQYIKEFQTDLRGIFKLNGLATQSSNEYYFAYDFYNSYILNDSFNIINTKQNTFTSLCRLYNKLVINNI
ncbi:hypothetical protein TTHERM_00268230 (macronuclear) [Tetrahymena thermophila SB210]|uniref:Uncharacterized protein n=1 Tax=Tetrahymena thermophila (strain SB210) TaxID=312017 RepID=I7MJ03_TETTS|nr:hypothetical protein TTHERM_00268230 [Tetrahymena thermophila SB210]EAR95712.2 hypothetical protein TTHERM_00268230 [Tetrahymena thermophila SB210]|eukprot:XP_001015957.2 hypothetical protein TTHERM_00268230 [Tetrahymena thermophila SB210]